MNRPRLRDGLQRLDGNVFEFKGDHVNASGETTRGVQVIVIGRNLQISDLAGRAVTGWIESVDSVTHAPGRDREHAPELAAAEAELVQASDADGLADIEFLACYRAWLAALRGEVPAAQAHLARLADLRATEDPQEQAAVGIAEAFTAAARGQPRDALRHARAILAHADALGIGAVSPCWAWPLAARCAYELADTTAARELLALLDRVEGLAAQAGGVDRLRAYLEALQEIAA